MAKETVISMATTVAGCLECEVRPRGGETVFVSEVRAEAEETVEHEHIIQCKVRCMIFIFHICLPLHCTLRTAA